MMFFYLAIFLLNCKSVSGIMCYICGQNDLQPPGECGAQFQYECAPYASKFPPTEHISCRTTRHRIGNGTYNVLKECIAMSEHLDMFPNGKMDGCTSLFDGSGFEVSYCICQWDFCNEKPLHMQIQKLEHIHINKSLALGEAAVAVTPVTPIFPTPPKFADDIVVVPQLNEPTPADDTVQAGLNSASGQKGPWSPFQNPAERQRRPPKSWSNDYGRESGENAASYPEHLDLPDKGPSLGAAFVIDSQKHTTLQRAFAKQPYDPESTSWIQYRTEKPEANFGSGPVDPEPDHLWKPAEVSNDNTPPTTPVLEGDAGNLVNSAANHQHNDNFHMQLPKTDLGNNIPAPNPDLELSVSSGSLELLPPAPAHPKWHQTDSKIRQSIPLVPSPLLCSECSEGGHAGPHVECTNQTIVECAQQESISFCFTRDTALINGQHSIEKKCVSENTLLQEYGDGIPIPGCETAWNGQVNFCICVTSNCNARSLAEQWLRHSSRETDEADQFDQLVEIQPRPPVTNFVADQHKQQETKKAKHNLTQQSCFVCGESDLSYPSDCVHQYEYNCSKQYTNSSHILCLTRQTKLASGLFSMEKRCISSDEHSQQYPGTQVVMHGCGEAWNGYVQYCVCDSRYCNKMNLTEQLRATAVPASETNLKPAINSRNGSHQQHRGSDFSSGPGVAKVNGERPRLTITKQNGTARTHSDAGSARGSVGATHGHTAQHTAPLITSLDLNPKAPPGGAKKHNIGRPDQLPPDFEKLLAKSNSDNRYSNNANVESYTAIAGGNYYDSIYERHLKTSSANAISIAQTSAVLCGLVHIVLFYVYCGR